ncbi:Uncharacterized protein TCM_003816 [Theobroma cacao]|uniref:Uncharacterized protein n=1 Tax=Theobroma cacao TaxID=3641 RepID=A0A061DW90_THECC|nr:Uncharacterized protein TCM_003816 [Theobroma cacao]
MRNISTNFKKKEMIATWSVSDDSQDEEDDEIANLYLMALDEYKVYPTPYNNDFYAHDENDYSFDELQDAYDDLMFEFEEKMLKYKGIIAKLKVENENLVKTRIKLENNVKNMQAEMNEMGNKDKSLHDTLSKFQDNLQKLNDMLKLQRAFFNKEGLFKITPELIKDVFDLRSAPNAMTHISDSLVVQDLERKLYVNNVGALDSVTIENVETSTWVHEKSHQEKAGNDNDDEGMPSLALTEPSLSTMPSSSASHISTDTRLDAIKETLEENG